MVHPTNKVYLKPDMLKDPMNRVHLKPDMLKQMEQEVIAIRQQLKIDQDRHKNYAYQ